MTYHQNNRIVFVLLSSIVFAISGCLDENGNSSTGQTPTSVSPIVINTPTSCETTKVALKLGSTLISEHTTIQQAVDASQSGHTIEVPRGEFKELVKINSKENIEISSICFPIVYGYQFTKSKNVKVSGFQIKGLPTGSAGFELLGGSDANTNIEISKSEISGIKASYNAINIKSQNSVKIIKNSIHDNFENGIYFDDSSKGGDHLIETNLITKNGKNGIVIAKQQVTLIKGNRITYNGYGVPEGEGYTELASLAKKEPASETPGWSPVLIHF